MLGAIPRRTGGCGGVRTFTPLMTVRTGICSSLNLQVVSALTHYLYVFLPTACMRSYRVLACAPTDYWYVLLPTTRMCSYRRLCLLRVSSSFLFLLSRSSFVTQTRGCFGCDLPPAENGACVGGLRARHASSGEQTLESCSWALQITMCACMAQPPKYRDHDLGSCGSVS